MAKPTHGGSRPIARKDDKRLKRKMQFSKHILVLDCTDEEGDRIKQRHGTRRRVEILLAPEDECELIARLLQKEVGRIKYCLSADSLHIDERVKFGRRLRTIKNALARIAI